MIIYDLKDYIQKNCKEKGDKARLSEKLNVTHSNMMGAVRVGSYSIVEKEKELYLASKSEVATLRKFGFIN